MFFFFFVVNFVRCEYKAICSMARANFKFSIKEIVSRKHGLVSYIDKSTCYCLCFAKICVKTKWISMHSTLPWLQRHIYRVRRFLPSVSCVSIRVILLSLHFCGFFIRRGEFLLFFTHHFNNAAFGGMRHTYSHTNSRKSTLIPSRLIALRAFQRAQTECLKWLVTSSFLLSSTLFFARRYFSYLCARKCAAGEEKSKRNRMR